jgi:predicted AAA+ superfamily ATPase
MSKLPSFLRSLYSKPLHRCLLLGVNDSGKTALLYRMLLDELVVSIPTIGFNCNNHLSTYISLVSLIKANINYILVLIR